MQTQQTAPRLTLAQALAVARNAGRMARFTNQPFTDRQYGANTLESCAFAAGWRMADFDLQPA